ncbi:MAG TPA: hypothetical protein VN641_03665 [Urbifossiella sp.]|nr:hypothetical protein [Urbifossiella sp.]
MPDTEVITCPACQHALRVPTDWLGTTVECPECRATFTAPRREGEFLTDPVLLSSPPPERTGRKSGGAILGIPAIGLMLVGLVSIAMNAYILVAIARNPVQFEMQKKADAEQIMKQLVGQNPQGGNAPAMSWQAYAGMAGWGAFCAAASFVAGLGMLLRRWLWLARIGSVLSFLNVGNCCCVPGGICGLWALILLLGPDARDRFSSGP